MEEYKFKKLHGDNYHAWAIRARALMVQKKCWEAVEPGYGPEMTENERRKNDEALTLMFLVVEDTFLDDIGECIRARDAWNSLKDIHTKYGLLHVLQLMKDFFNIVMKPGETVQSYLARLMEIHRKLSNGGYAFTDREVALVMLIGLPKSYENLILNLEKDEASLTTAVVKSKLMIEEKRISRNAINSDNYEERALHVRNFAQKKTQENSSKKWQPKKTSEPNNPNVKKHTKCFSCGEWGHISRNCDEARQKGQSVAKTAIDLNTSWALLAGMKEESNSNLWILDSGATEHMTSDRRKFTTLKNYSSVVEVANSERVEVTGTGDVMLSVPEDAEGRKNITLANVLYVPNLGGNLLSIGRIEERGFKIEFADGMAKILSKSETVVLEAKRRGRLYIVEENQPAAYITKTATNELWHRRLGHPCQNAMKNIEHSSSEEESPIVSNKPCSICIQGKMKRKRFPKCSNTQAKDVLEVIHSDVVGKITPPSLGGSNYFVVFTDDFSRHTTVYPMKTKSEVLQKFHEYRCMSEKLHNKRIKTLRSDNGGEFKSNDFNMYLVRHGIQRQLTVPESPQQNGVSERRNQTLVNITRCLLIESGASPEFWAEAVCTASYLHNRRPSTAIDGNMPEKMWSGKEVDLNNLKVFGCRAWSHVRSFQRRSKLEPKATECILAGYPDGVKGYKLWDLKEKKFLISRDVIFEEDSFPFKSQQYQQHENDDDVVLSIENEEVIDDIDTNVMTDQDKYQAQNIAEHEYPDESHKNLRQHSSQSNQLSSNDPENSENHPNQQVEEAESCSDEETEQSEAETSFEAPSYNKRTSTRTIKAPERLNDYVLYNAKEISSLYPNQMNKDPITVKEALASPEANLWQKAMEEEIGNLQKAQTWELVPRPPSAKVITSKWVFRKKRDNEGKCIKFKARLVARGYQQLPGIDFHETYSPVIKLKSIRTLLAIAVEMDFEVHQMDITAAYLNGVLEEDIYMIQPEGCTEKNKEHLVCHLKKSLYGLKQSGRVWNSCLDNFLTNYGLKRSNADPCIYNDLKRGLIIGIYVDDLLIIGKLSEVEDFKREIKKQFAAKDLGPAAQILSMQITKEDDGSITLDQTGYISEVLDTFKMSEAKPAATPLDPSIKYSHANDQEWEKVKEESKKNPYRQVVGSLLYLACGTRPDLSYPSTYMSQFNERPTAEHWRGVKHMLRYLRGTKFRKLRFQKTGKKLQAYSDADWGGDIIDRKSFSGYVLLLAGGPVSWSSKKQTSVALSSTEAEYISMCHATKEVLWFQNLLSEICPNLVDTTQKILVDNQGAIFISKNHATSERSKHIDLKYFFLRDLVKKKTILFEHVPSENNIADVMTKRVSKRILQEHRHAMTVE